MTISNAIVTAYCACSICCGPGRPIGANGKLPKSNISIAAPRNIPLNTTVTVILPSGRRIRRVVHDRTALRYDGRWDIYLPTHKSAKAFGIQRGTVIIE